MKRNDHTFTSIEYATGNSTPMLMLSNPTSPNFSFIADNTWAFEVKDSPEGADLYIYIGLADRYVFKLNSNNSNGLPVVWPDGTSVVYTYADIDTLILKLLGTLG